MNTQLTPRALDVIADSGETGELPLRNAAPGSSGGEAKNIDRCPCGYPMPCSHKVPVTFCRAAAGERA